MNLVSKRVMMSGGSFFDDKFQCKWKINKDFLVRKD